MPFLNSESVFECYFIRPNFDDLRVSRFPNYFVDVYVSEKA